MRRNRIWPIMLVVVGTLVLGACGGDGQSPAVAASPEAKFPLTVPSCERTVTIKQPAKRVLTVASDSATTLAAIGAADRIIARSAEGGAPLVQRRISPLGDHAALRSLAS